MDIKIYSLLSCIPLWYIIYKLIHKRDLNCFDILLCFHTLYFAIIPLIFDIKDIEYSEVRNNQQIRFDTFIYYTLFIYTLLLFDIYYSSKQNTNSLFNLTYSIRQWMRECSLKNSIIYKILAIEILLIIIQYIAYNFSIMVGIGSMEDMRQNAKALQSPFIMFILGSASLLRSYVLFILAALWIKNKFSIKKERYLFYLAILILVILYLQISRTYIFEFVVIIGLIVYSIYKEKLKLGFYIKSSIGILFVVGVIFPFVTAFRAAKRFAISNEQTSVAETVHRTFKILLDGNSGSQEIDNKATRSWGAYQNLALSSYYPYEGNGDLTLASIKYGIPQIIYPQKSKIGSQDIIERELKRYTDLTDSVLLFAQMENRAVGFIYANIIFICILFIWEKLRMSFLRFLKNDIIIPLFFVETIFLISRIETSPDQFLSTFIQFMIWPIIIYFLIGKSVNHNIHYS